ncbi:hypothetical protein [Mycobacteroides stephanolepidis]|uniref:hypothetical protein n=1 Tax=[Mycobacterium] stephanolepidis TaxID=1520670 RepID=UPI001300B297|nr:hypothetical protein [[Mycobacterium] stephanolepidis]
MMKTVLAACAAMGILAGCVALSAPIPDNRIHCFSGVGASDSGRAAYPVAVRDEVDSLRGFRPLGAPSVPRCLSTVNIRMTAVPLFAVGVGCFFGWAARSRRAAHLNNL